MAVIALMLAASLTCGPEVAVDQRPVLASRADAIIQASRQDSADAPAPAATPVCYPSADGDILAGLGKAMAIPPPGPPPPLSPERRAPSAPSRAVDSSGLLGGPRQ